MSIGPQITTFRRVLRKEEVRSLSRRYFIANAFDGTLTTVGVVIGAYLSGIEDGLAIIAIGLGAAVGLGTSGIWSVWEIERAETSRERARIETAMLIDLEDTRLTRDLRSEQIVLAIAAATGPVLAILITLTPFLFVGPFYSVATGTLMSVGVGVVLLGLVGAYLGTISQQRWWIAALRMGAAGIVVALISIVLPG